MVSSLLQQKLPVNQDKLAVATPRNSASSQGHGCS